MRRHRTRWLLALTAVALGTAVVATLGLTVLGWGGRGGSEQAAPVASQGPVFVRYQDPQGRFAISYPQSWQRLPSSDPQVALVLRAGPASQDSVLVRIVQLAKPVDLAHLDGAHQVTDALVRGSDVRVLVERPITLNGMPGFYYLYTFGQPGSGRFGIHAHYFLFASPTTVDVLVCQALPDTDFVTLAPLFDQVAQSYQALPAAAPNPGPSG